jgi:hypothetical protein
VDGWLQATSNVHCADGVLVVYVGLADGGNGHEYLAGGRTKLTFGGVTVVPLEPSESLCAPTTTHAAPILRRDKGAISNWLRRRLDRAEAETAKVYIYQIDHEHDRTYTENVVQYLEGQGVLCRSIPLRADGLRPELQLCLDDHATAVLGFNADLDHSWLPSGSFLEAAGRRGIPVLQWILDHPSARWAEFYNSTSTNSRFLLNSECERQYFEAYCLPGALTATMGGVGPNRRSRIARLTRQAFMQRRFACIVPLSLHRVRSMAQNDEAMCALEAPLVDVARGAIASAQFDLIGALQPHLTAALVARNMSVSSQTFNSICQVVEQSVQTIRRLKIFSVAQKYPVLIQSDSSATSYIGGSTAVLETNVGMQFTIARIPMCRAMLSVSPINEMIHDRTMNAINAGCVAILEDSLVGRTIFKHGQNALLFRYDDDSIAECLDIVCNQPERAYTIAQAGMKLRDDPRLRFGKFRNILDLARRPM